ncbi:hypothetical protein Aperf_G00000099346 [Anoplocephala perfoliata]
MDDCSCFTATASSTLVCLKRRVTSMDSDKVSRNGYGFEKARSQAHEKKIGCGSQSEGSDLVTTKIILPKQSIPIFEKFLKALNNRKQTSPILLVPSSKNSEGCFVSLNKRNSVVGVWNEKKGNYLLADVPKSGYSLASIENTRQSTNVRFIRPRKECIFALTSRDNVVEITSPMIAKPWDKREPLIPLEVSKNFPSNLCFRDFEAIINAVSLCWPKDIKDVAASTKGSSISKAPEEGDEIIGRSQVSEESPTIGLKQSSKSGSKSSDESDSQLTNPSSSIPATVIAECKGDNGKQDLIEKDIGIEVKRKKISQPFRNVYKRAASSVTSSLSSESSFTSAETLQSSSEESIAINRSGTKFIGEPSPSVVHKRSSSSATSSLSSEMSSTSAEFSQPLPQAHLASKKYEVNALMLNAEKAKSWAENCANSKVVTGPGCTSDIPLTSVSSSSTFGSSEPEEVKSPEEKTQGKRKRVEMHEMTSSTSPQLGRSAHRVAENGDREKDNPSECGDASSASEEPQAGSENIKPSCSGQKGDDSKLKPQQSEKEPSTGATGKASNLGPSEIASQALSKDESQPKATSGKSVSGTHETQPKSCKGDAAACQLAREAILAAIATNPSPPPSSGPSKNPPTPESGGQSGRKCPLYDQLPDLLRPHAEEIEKLLAVHVELPSPPSSPRFVRQVPRPRKQKKSPAAEPSSSNAEASKESTSSSCESRNCSVSCEI